MDVDYLHFDELLDLVRAAPATSHDADIPRYHFAVVASMPLPFARLESVDGVPELVELVMHAETRAYGIFFGYTPAGVVLRAYGYWRDPATEHHSRGEALKTARIRYWMDQTDG